ncbi:hypothetical protein [Aminirod propionatiphilus]|uniref:Uncharacterized protein n=1 Tax=Aminirod propionatiphilus TaxID=3415223 RepID=A0ACD1DXT4_9BACT|nr:hypothetical protein KIH16_04500 [Synergistota bacterium]
MSNVDKIRTSLETLVADARYLKSQMDEISEWNSLGKIKANVSKLRDLVGNCAEWVDGLKLVDGKILMPVDNNIDLAEASWPDSGYRIDATAEGDASSGTGSIGDPVLSNAVTRYAGPQGDDAMYAYTSLANWTALTAKSGMTVPASLVLAGIAPLSLASGTYDTPPQGYFYTRNYGTRFPLRGGRWSSRGSAGLATLNLNYPRSNANGNISFRPALLHSPMRRGHGYGACARRKGALPHLPCGEKINSCGSCK